MTTAVLTFKFNDGSDYCSIFFRSDGHKVLNMFKTFCQQVDLDTEIYGGRLNFHYFVSNALAYFMKEYSAHKPEGHLNNLVYILPSHSDISNIDFLYTIHPIMDKYSDFSIPAFETFNVEVKNV